MLFQHQLFTIKYQELYTAMKLLPECEPKYCPIMNLKDKYIATLLEVQKKKNEALGS